MNSERNNIKISLIWKILERFSYHGVKLLVQIFLARILFPSDFGILSIVLVFIDLATIFVQSGLNTALIQNENSGEEEFSTIFWITVILSVVFYITIFFTSPVIASFYNNESIAVYLRVIGLILFGGAFNSIQIAYSSKNHNFKSQFISNFISVFISGIIAIILAKNSFGVWSLIYQQLIWQYLNCIIMLFFCKWRPKFIFDFNCAKVLLPFGFKVFLSSLLIRLNTIASNLIIGKKYTTNDLGFYSKASNFPTAFSDVVVNAISSVALVNFSDYQNDKSGSKIILEKYVKFSYFLIFPIMFGLAAIAEPFVVVLLTEKWLECVPYLWVFCGLYIFQPLCAIYGQALCGHGRSDLYLRTYLIVKPVGVLLVLAATFLTESPIYIGIAVVLTSVIETISQAINIKKQFEIKLSDQFKYWSNNIIPAIIMFGITYSLNMLSFNYFLKLVIQIAVGALSYFAATYIINKTIIKSFTEYVKGKKKVE